MVPILPILNKYNISTIILFFDIISLNLSEFVPEMTSISRMLRYKFCPASSNYLFTDIKSLSFEHFILRKCSFSFGNSL